MLSLSRNKVLIVSLIFAGFALLGVGLLANQGDGTQTFENPISPENPLAGELDPESGTEASNTDTEGLRTGPPALFANSGSDPMTGAAYLQAFADLYKKSPEQFRERALQALDGPYPREAREAALTVWYRWNYEDRVSPFRRILVASNTDTGTNDQNQDLESFAVDFLAKGAHEAVEVREVLADYIEAKPEDPTLRKQAWSSVLRWGRIKEIHRSLPSLYAEREPICIQAAAQALQQTRESGSRAILRELSKRHPQRAAREQFKELLTQR